jgi:FAD/FMN-containing dehydrogenase
MSIAEAVTKAAETFTGQLLTPGDPGYDEARRVHNGLIDKHPALIARCRGTADVVDAMKIGRELGLPIAVRGGGHNVAGRATIDDGLMIDLSPMKGIHVDPHARTARAQGGVLWKEFNRETEVHGLATTGGVVGSTGIAGLTLGGGVGWLMPKYGLALDNLRSAEMVMADGRVFHANENEHADLFWAIRGGGGNFGIATSLQYQLHQVGPIITGGVVAHPFAAAYDVLRFFRDQCADVPDEVMFAAGLQHTPEGFKVAGIIAAHCGRLDDGAEFVLPIKAFGSPAMDAMGPIPYTVLNGLIDGAFPKGALNYWRAQFMNELTDEAIRTLIACYDKAPSPLCDLVLEHFHGAVSRIPVDATACALRVTGFNVVIISQWMDPSQTEAGIRWAKETHQALKPFMSSVRYMNYLEDDLVDPAAHVYGPNLPRLRALKAKYDPQNVFRQNVNITPA